MEGINKTLGTRVAVCIVLDSDYRSKDHCELIKKECREFADLVTIHGRKEIENYLLVPTAIDRALQKRLTRSAEESKKSTSIDSKQIIEDFADSRKDYVMAQRLAAARSFMKHIGTSDHETLIYQSTLEDVSASWKQLDSKIAVIPGKEALSFLNKHFQDNFGVSLTPAAIIDAMRNDDVPQGMKELIVQIDAFAKKSPTAECSDSVSE